MCQREGMLDPIFAFSLLEKILAKKEAIDVRK
jgi:hypothetical protein